MWNDKLESTSSLYIIYCCNPAIHAGIFLSGNKNKKKASAIYTEFWNVSDGKLCCTIP